MFEDSLDAGMHLTRSRMEATGETYEDAAKAVRAGLSYMSQGAYHHETMGEPGKVVSPAIPGEPSAEQLAHDHVSAWMPEEDVHVHQIIAKLGEELSEAAARCFRILESGYFVNDPDTNEPNWYELNRELDDIQACLMLGRSRGYFFKNDTKSSTDRVAFKLAGFKHWHNLIDIELKKKYEAANAGRGPG